MMLLHGPHIFLVHFRVKRPSGKWFNAHFRCAGTVSRKTRLTRSVYEDLRLPDPFFGNHAHAMVSKRRLSPRRFTAELNCMSHVD